MGHQLPLLMIIAVMCMGGVGLEAQTLELLYPQAGDTLYIGDTVTIRYTADSTYRTVGTGTVLSLSPNLGDTWFEICAIQTPDFCPIPVRDTCWGHPRIVVPDTLRNATVTVVLPSDQMLVRLHDYNNEMIMCISSGPFVIAHRSSSVLPTPAPQPLPALLDDSEGGDDGACGTGALCALLPPLGLCIVRRVRRRKTS